MANQLGKAIFQVRPRGKSYGELAKAGSLYAWKWKTIEKVIERLLNENGG